MKAIFFSFRGRTARLPYFGYGLLLYVLTLTPILLSFFLSTLFRDLGSLGADGSLILSILSFSLIVLCVVLNIWGTLALSAKRLHDLGASGFHLVWVWTFSAAGGLLLDTQLVPDENLTVLVVGMTLNVVALAGLAWMFFWPGQARANQFGPVPGTL